MEDSPQLLQIPSQNAQTFGYVYHDKNGPNHGPGRKVSNWECFASREKKTILVCVCGRQELAGKKEHTDPVWKVPVKQVGLID